MTAQGPLVLYAGRRRLDVANRFGFNPHRPRVVPPDVAEGHHINRRAYEFLIDPRRRDRLRETLHRLTLLKKKRGTKDQPVRRRRGKYAFTDLEIRERPLRAEAFEGENRLLAWCVRRCNWRTGEVGVFVGGKIKPLSRAAIAERAGFPVRLDGKKRVRAYQLDRRIEQGVVAGLLFRHEEERGTRVVLKLTPLAWIKAGVANLRDRYIEQARKEKKAGTKEAARLARAELEAYEREKAARRGERKDPEMALVVSQAAAAATNDTDFTDPSVRGWLPRKPPS